MSAARYPQPELISGAASAPDDYDADVIILAMDRAEETIAAIASARAQQGVAKHVWIADQGSTPENLDRLAAAVAGAEDATLVRLDRNHGVAGGRNRASALGHARAIFALDNDAEFADEATLARAVAALDEAPDLAAVGCRILVYATGAEDFPSWGYPISLFPKAASSFDACTFVGAGHAIRRAAWDQASGYDDALFFCWEEFDFSLRAINRGWRIRYRGDIAVRHKVSGEHRFSWSGTRWHYFVRNRLYIELKSGASVVSLLPRFLAYTVRGARNGVLRQGLAAGPAALRLARDAPRQPPTEVGRAYMAKNDAVYRGGLLGRFRREILATLPAAK